MAGTIYHLVIEQKSTGKVLEDRWFNTEAERRGYFDNLEKSDSKRYLIGEKDPPSLREADPGEWGGPA